MKHKQTIAFLLTFLLALPGLCILISPQARAQDLSGPFLVKRVIDGDTIVLADGRHVRYLGINSPEHGEPSWKEAKDYNALKVKGRMVSLEFGEVLEDKYGRTLAYVFVGGEMVNAELLQAGLAHLFVLEPIPYYDNFLRFQEEARSKGLGIWGKDGFRGPLKITNLHADAPGDDRQNLNGEYVRICNVSARAVNLKGFAISDHAGHRYVFPRGLLRPGYTLLLLTGAGRDIGGEDQLFFYWGSTYPIWNNRGDRATLHDPRGGLVDTFVYRERF
jgi:micrococcal nuclease